MPKTLNVAVGTMIALLPFFAGCGASKPAAAPRSVPATTTPSNSTGSAATPSQTASPTKLTTVTIGLPAKTALGAIELYLARDLGYFQQEGLKPKFEVMHPSESLAALANGNLDFQMPLDGTANGAEKGLPVRIVMVIQQQPEFYLIGAKGITKVSQLRGKTVITGTAHGEINGVLIKKTLAAMGLPAGAYKVDYAPTPTAIALLSSNKASASMMDMSNALRLMQKGYPELFTLIHRYQLPATGLGTSLNMIHNHPDIVRKVITAALNATKVLANDKSKSVPLIAKDFGLSQQTAGKLWDLNQGTWILSGKGTASAEKVMLQLDQTHLKLKTPPKIAQVFDYSLVPSS